MFAINIIFVYLFHLLIENSLSYNTRIHLIMKLLMITKYLSIEFSPLYQEKQ
jgi:hypothetical protein